MAATVESAARIGIVSSPTEGRYVVALEDLPEGTLVHASLPYAFAPVVSQLITGRYSNCVACLKPLPHHPQERTNRGTSVPTGCVSEAPVCSDCSSVYCSTRCFELYHTQHHIPSMECACLKALPLAARGRSAECMQWLSVASLVAARANVENPTLRSLFPSRRANDEKTVIPTVDVSPLSVDAEGGSGAVETRKDSTPAVGTSTSSPAQTTSVDSAFVRKLKSWSERELVSGSGPSMASHERERLPNDAELDPLHRFGTTDTTSSSASTPSPTGIGNSFYGALFESDLWSVANVEPQGAGGPTGRRVSPLVSPTSTSVSNWVCNTALLEKSTLSLFRQAFAAYRSLRSEDAKKRSAEADAACHIGGRLHPNAEKLLQKFGKDRKTGGKAPKKGTNTSKHSQGKTSSSAGPTTEQKDRDDADVQADDNPCTPSDPHAASIFPLMTEDEFVRVCGAVKCNGFECSGWIEAVRAPKRTRILPLESEGINDGESVPPPVMLGTALYPLASYFNHSCDPNLLLPSHGKVMLIYTSRAVKRGEPLTFSYLNVAEVVAALGGKSGERATSNPPSGSRVLKPNRRLDLANSFCFWCRCSACDPKGTGTPSTMPVAPPCPLCQLGSLRLVNGEELRCRRRIATDTFQRLLPLTDTQLDGKVIRECSCCGNLFSTVTEIKTVNA
jgi:hypothetical protein